MRRPSQLILLVLPAILPSTGTAQTPGSLFVGAEVGRYDLHGCSGAALAVYLGRRWDKHVLLQMALTQGLGDDRFTALEPGLEIQLLSTEAVNVFVGGGAGLMWEIDGTAVVLPYFGRLGAEARVGPRTRVRAAVRRGSHMNFGDSGAFRGPHIISLGVVREL